MPANTSKAKMEREIRRQRLIKWTQEMEAKKIKQHEARKSRLESRENRRSERPKSCETVEEEEDEQTPKHLLETSDENVSVKRVKTDVIIPLSQNSN
jgi:hypothetical protein